MKRCTRCILPDTVPGLSFDQNGICNCCKKYNDEKYYGEKALMHIIELSRKKDNRYDCIVPLSGGRDSTYVLYLAVKRYRLKVLAVSYDNEFRNPQAFQNMTIACQKLGVELKTIRSKINIASRIVKSKIQSSKSLVDMTICGQCTYGYRSIVYVLAEKYHIPLIFWGESQLEATQDYEGEAFKNLGIKREKYLKLFRPSFYKTELLSLLQRMQFHVAGNSILHRGIPKLKNKEIKEIKIFDYIEWNRKIIKKTIMNELGWKMPRESVSTWRTDCDLHTLLNYFYFKMFGCSKECFGYCKMINSEQMNRKEALEQEEALSIHIHKKIPELLKNRIGLSDNEVKRILNLQV